MVNSNLRLLALMFSLGVTPLISCRSSDKTVVDTNDTNTSNTNNSSNLVAGSFKKQLTPAKGFSNSSLFSELTSYAKSQFFYPTGDINAAGNVAAITITYDGSMPSSTCQNVTITMGHDKGSLITVLSDATLTFPSGKSELLIPLTTPFEYNGAEGLLVDFERNSACSCNVYASLYKAVVTSPLALGFSFTGGDDLAWFGDSGTMNNYPFSGYTNRMQMLYPASTINGEGSITGVGVVVAAPTTSQYYKVTIKLGHSKLPDLTSTFDDNYSEAPTIVANNLAFEVHAGAPAGSRLWLPFDGSFTYNGVDNLILDIDVTTSSAGSTEWLSSGVITHQQRVLGSSGAQIGFTSYLSPHSTWFRFNGGQLVVLPSAAADSSAQVLGDSAAGQVQSLYPKTLLGTSGTIHSVYVRLSPDALPTETALNNYKLYMGHTDKGYYQLTDSYASNMNENSLVMSGNLAIPAGTTAGDWIKIALDTPFFYNSQKNLSVMFSTDAGPAGNRVATHTDNSLMPAHSAGRNDNIAATIDKPSWLYNGIVDLKLDLQK